MEGRARTEIAVVALGAALAATVIGIGFASGEVIRHLVQAAPVVVVTLLAWRMEGWERWLLGPAFAFWLFIAACIGLFLAHLPSPVSGTFNVGERSLTLTLAVVSVAAFANFPRIRQRRPIELAVLVTLLAAGLQIAAFWLSLQPAIAHR